MKRLVLIGGGHAHLEVLRRCIEDGVPSGAEVTLISPAPRQVYSGMIPGYLHGAYDENDIAFDLPAICRAGGVRYLETSVDRVANSDRFVEAGGTRVEFDVASLDVGSVSAGANDPTVQEYASFVRPLEQLIALREKVDVLGREREGGVPVITVVGAGAAGVEVALALRARMSASGRTVVVSLMDEADDVLPGYPSRMRRRAHALLNSAGVQVVGGDRVVSVNERTIRLADGTRVESHLTVWLTGATAPPLLAASDLPTGSTGFFLVDEHLRSVDGAPVWGAGDCVTLSQAPHIRKAGVYAVREGPALANNLWASIKPGLPLATYVPQEDFLVALDTADGKALLRWHGIISHSRGALWFKRRIDRRFMERYRDLIPIS